MGVYEAELYRHVMYKPQIHDSLCYVRKRLQVFRVFGNIKKPSESFESDQAFKYPKSQHKISVRLLTALFNSPIDSSKIFLLITRFGSFTIQIPIHQPPGRTGHLRPIRERGVGHNVPSAGLSLRNDAAVTRIPGLPDLLDLVHR